MGALTIVLGLVAVLLLLYLACIHLFKEESENPARADALLRYIATQENDITVRCTDNFAQHFISSKLRFLFRWELFRSIGLTFIERRTPGLYGQVVARTRMWDDKIREILKNNHIGGERDRFIEQVVFLGCGFDSRPYRFEQNFKERDVKVFEVESSTILAEKKATMSRFLYELPDNISYVPADITTETKLFSKLQKAGYDKKKTTLFVMEHVTAYMKTERIEDLFKMMRECSAIGSFIYFDFIKAHAYDDPNSCFGFKETRLHYENIYNLSWDEGLNIDSRVPGNLLSWLAERGYFMQKHIPTKELRRFTFTGSGSRVASISAYIQFVECQSLDDDDRKRMVARVEEYKERHRKLQQDKKKKEQRQSATAVKKNKTSAAEMKKRKKKKKEGTDKSSASSSSSSSSSNSKEKDASEDKNKKNKKKKKKKKKKAE